jgi:ureidoglycolate lyase
MMRKVQVRELSLENFQAYGTFKHMVNPKDFHLGEPPIEFYRDMLQLNLGTNSASFSICRVHKRPMVVEKSEFHSKSGEGILPLDSDILIHCGPATRPGVFPAEHIEIFRVPKLTLVSLRPGVWHHAPFALKADYANVLIVLPERTYANDCAVLELSDEQKIEINA